MASHRNLYRKFLARELSKTFREAYHDRDRAELIARGNYTFLSITRGEVLKAPRYLNPSLQKAFEALEAKPARRPFKGKDG
ncbi:hypothetical protein DRO53_00430 [Candidatus Bathyarchaeota archaeon]|nr:MAG: hypothetical protein DRO53_00430 [Candidatus Bathyarchaeota archaeon]